MAEKIDLFKTHKAAYVQPKNPTLLKIDPAQYLVIDCQGKPGGDGFNDAMTALYGGAFTIKMASKKRGFDYTVCKLEAVWTSLENWTYSMMIRTPDFISETELLEAQQTLIEKGKTPCVKALQLETLDEGLCVQMLHVGPYENEGETVEIMKAHALEHGLKLYGRHHEIYISDPRRVPPERLKTILRHPVR